ncbi:acyltransferase [Colwellia sp. BRX8-9]|uniref:acyltransferase family protein n=1 Tax=Colwellia sp. BRX8-9 TaxID=2759831 RepID=UPI0015F61ED8|nr:acyltransferase [Colwellia sp. BRX8-9]MBA6348681.1 acyltransferase [Colwellia sp. BRX8-9]
MTIRQKLNGIEVARGVAALLVVFYHISRLFEQNSGYFPLGRFTEIGHSGVDFFFVLSGFIIYFIHRKDIGHKSQLKPYILKRLVRIFPLFWIVFFLHLTLIPFVSSTDFPTITSGLLQLLLFPIDKKELVIGVSWTLQYEMMFYILFALLILNRMIGRAVFAFWFLILAIQFTGLQNFNIPLFTSAFCFQFMAGMVAARIVSTVSIQHLKYFFYIGTGLLLMTWWAELANLLNGYGKNSRLFYGIAFALVVIGIVTIENGKNIEYPKVWLILGKSSYSIYLTHLFFGGIYYKIMDLMGVLIIFPSFISLLIVILFTVVSGVLFSNIIEFPVTKYLRSKLIVNKHEIAV